MEIRQCRNVKSYVPANNSADARVATGAGDVVSAKPLGIVAIGRVLRAQRLPERNLADAPSVANHSLVLGTVQVRHHPSTHQQVGLHIESKVGC